MNRYLNNDYFKIGRPDNISLVRNINLSFLVIFLIIIINIIFFSIMFSTTYYSHLGEIEGDIKEYKTKGQLEFDNINMDLKIMPSYNTENNVILLEKVNDNKITRIKESLGLIESYDLKSTYFMFNKTKNVFPKLDYKKDAIPVGNSIKMCFNLAWGEKDSKYLVNLEGRQYDMMKQVINFPQCEQSKSGRFIWNDKDSKYGIDIPIWVQHEHIIDCANDNECDYNCQKNYNAVYVNAKRGKKCYSYEVISGVCLSIQYDSIINEYKYIGGCFKDNDNYLLETAKINQIYDFSGVEIEIRNINDPIIQAGLTTNYSFNFGGKLTYLASFFKFLIYISILLGLAIGIIISLEKNKKPSDKLINVNNSQEMKCNNTESSLRGNTQHTLHSASEPSSNPNTARV